MPCLDWSKREDVQARTEPHARLQTQLSLTLSPERLAELRAELQEVFGATSVELRLALPLGWTVYWKTREGDSRLLLAHPEQDAWVASISLNEPHAARLLNELGRLSAGTSYCVSELRHFGPWSGISNLEVVITIAA